MIRGLAVVRNPVKNLLISLYIWARRNFAAIELIKGRLAQNMARGADRLDPLATILGGRKVVEAQRGVHAWVGRLDLDRAARVGIHRPDVYLIAMPIGRRAAIVADRQRQEVEHHIR